MAAANNESQGLKIAVAVFVTLSVVMAVGTYFSYSAYSDASARFAKSEGDLSTARRAQSDIANERDALLKEIGARGQDQDAYKAELKAEYKKIDDELKTMSDQVIAAVGTAQQAGATGPELEDAKAKVQQITAAYRSEPNKTYVSALARMTELLKNLAMLTTQTALNYTDVKRNLENANSVNAGKLKVETDAVASAKTDLTGEHQKHEAERQSLLARIDRYDSDNSRMQTEIANLTGNLRELEDDSKKKLETALSVTRGLRSQIDSKETVLDRPDGNLTYVDYTRGEVHTNLTRSQGARPQMRFAIFEAGSPGLPTEKPKGTIMLTSVDDRGSIGQIIKTFTSINPLHEGDIVYSSVWSPNDPMRIALIGKIDINRDGVDDRQDLKRMIQGAGGIVDYDLPPTDVGKETGKLTGRDAYYVTDDRETYRDMIIGEQINTPISGEFLQKRSAAVKEASSLGIRPIPVERLLTYLGYDYAAPTRGRAEAQDTKAQKRLLAPQPNQSRPRADAGAAGGDAGAGAAGTPSGGMDAQPK